jgi:hypothetical protein
VPCARLARRVKYAPQRMDLCAEGSRMDARGDGRPLERSIAGIVIQGDAVILYKYLPPDLLQVLRDRRLRFTQPADFNDAWGIRRRIYRDGVAQPLLALSF